MIYSQARVNSGICLTCCWLNVFSHTCSAELSQRLQRTHRNISETLCIILSLALCPTNARHPREFQSPFLQLRQTLQPGNCLWAEVWVSCRAHLTELVVFSSRIVILYRFIADVRKALFQTFLSDFSFFLLEINPGSSTSSWLEGKYLSYCLSKQEHDVSQSFAFSSFLGSGGHFSPHYSRLMCNISRIFLVP